MGGPRRHAREVQKCAFSFGDRDRENTVPIALFRFCLFARERAGAALCLSDSTRGRRAFPLDSSERRPTPRRTYRVQGRTESDDTDGPPTCARGEKTPLERPECRFVDVGTCGDMLDALSKRITEMGKVGIANTESWRVNTRSPKEMERVIPAKVYF